jgi:hypothetical protein
MSACASCIWPALAGTDASGSKTAAVVAMANKVLLMNGSSFWVGLRRNRKKSEMFQMENSLEPRNKLPANFVCYHRMLIFLICV